MIGKTIIHFNILEMLSEGGMGVAFKARDIQLDRTVVALKLLPSNLSADEHVMQQIILEVLRSI